MLPRAGRALAITLLVAGLIIYAAGRALPARHTATGEAHLNASVTRVFRVITAVDEYPQWRPDVSAVEWLDAPGGRTWRERIHGDAITFEVIDVRAPTRFVVRIADPGLPFGGTWTYELAPSGAGTRLRITEDGEVSNPFFRVVARYLLGYDATVRSYLRDLEAHLSVPSAPPRVP